MYYIIIHIILDIYNIILDWLDLLAVQGTLESYPTQELKTINSSVFSFLYGPTLTSIHHYWKNFDYMDFCDQSNVSAV